MKIIIPAAGEGVRLRPHTRTRPKPLLRLAGKTVIDFVLEPLVKLSPSEIVLVVGYRGEQMAGYVADHYQIPLTSVKQDKLLGLGYAVHLGLEAIDLDEDVLIILADTIIQTDFQKFISAGDNTIALKQVDDPRRFGVAEIEDGHISKLVEKPEKPKSDLAVVGLYYFRQPKKLNEALKTLINSGRKTAGEIQLTDALSLMLESGESFTPYTIDGWLDCGKRETMLSTSATLLEDCDGQWIDPSSSLENCSLKSNVTIYQRCHIENSTLEDCIIGPGCRIESCELTKTILGEGVFLQGVSGSVDLGDDGLREETPVVSRQ